jgi:hypothetical protein
VNNNREKILLTVFLAALFIVGGVVAWKWITSDLQTRREALVRKDAELVELQRWIAEKNVWENREAWMKARPMPPYLKQRSEAEFVQTIQGSLSKYGIQTVDQRIQETRQSGSFVEVPIDLTLDATLEELIRWLYDVQRPDSFRVISQIRLRSTGDSAKIRAEISLYQIFTQENT